jgi:hypothetical protein
MDILKTIGGFIMEIFKQIAKLIDVKSIVTLAFTFTMARIVLNGLVLEQNIFNLFSNALMLILGFFFGKKADDTK